MKILIEVSGGVVTSVFLRRGIFCDPTGVVKIHVRDNDNIEAGELDSTPDELRAIVKKEYQVY